MSFRKVLSAILAAVLVAGCLPMCVTALAAPVPAELCEETYVPDGEPSDSGYQRYKLVDENGDEVVRKEYRSRLSRNRGAELPASYDLRDEGRVSDTILNQGATGACWAYSSIGAVESSLITGGYGDEDTLDYSEAHLSWFAQNSLCTDPSDPSFGEGEVAASPFTSGGNWKDAATCVARGSGLELDSEAPMDTVTPSSMSFGEPRRFISETFLEQVQYITSAPSAEGRDKVKRLIVENGAVMVTYRSYPGSSFYHRTSAGKAYYQNTSVIQDHAVLIIGWDDSFAVSNFNPSALPASPGAWLCRNSWGSSFSTDGCFWLSYCDASVQDFTSFTAVPRDGGCRVDNTYQYDNAGGNKVVSSSSFATVSAGNVFVSGGGEAVEAASFWTEQTNLDYTVKIYTDLPSDYTDPECGVLAATVSGAAAYKGYHTVYLDEAVALSAGERFSVVVTLTAQRDQNGEITSDLGTPRICLEGDYAQFTANAGESFINFNVWADATRYGSKLTNYKNVKIKAHTSNTDSGAQARARLEAALDSADALSVYSYSGADWQAISAAADAARSVAPGSPAAAYNNARLRLRAVVDSAQSLGTLRVTSGGAVEMFSDLNTAAGFIGAAEGTVMLCGDVSAASTVDIYGNVTLINDGKARTISRGDVCNGNMLCVKPGAELTLGGSVLALDPTINIDGGSRGVGGAIILNEGTLKVCDGVSMRANISSGEGGAVSNLGTMDFCGGMISESRASVGSGIYNGGTLYMSGSAAVARECDIYLAEGCAVTLRGELTHGDFSGCVVPSSYTAYRRVLAGTLAGNTSRFTVRETGYEIDREGCLTRTNALDTAAGSAAYTLYAGADFGAPRHIVGLGNMCTVGEARAMLRDVTDVEFFTAAGDALADSERLGTGNRIVRGGEELTVIIFGDISGDGKVDSLDVSEIARASVELTLLTELGMAAADINGDGTVDSFDVSAVSRASAMLADIDASYCAHAYYMKLYRAANPGDANSGDVTSGDVTSGDVNFGDVTTRTQTDIEGSDAPDERTLSADDAPGGGLKERLLAAILRLLVLVWERTVCVL